eukprot:2513-Heterococcus_DN1.PRE.3
MNAMTLTAGCNGGICVVSLVCLQLEPPDYLHSYRSEPTDRHVARSQRSDCDPVRRLAPLSRFTKTEGCMDSKTSTLNPIRALRNKLDKRHGSSSNTTREQKLLERQPSGL